MAYKPVDITGVRFGNTVAVEIQYREYKSGRRERGWLCLCDCGHKHWAATTGLLSGLVQRCWECRNTNIVVHGAAKTNAHWPEYSAWHNMKDRCLNSNAQMYKHYGGRGIKICDRWLESFQNFFDYVGHRPSSDHSIDRINNNGNYEPGNVRWATPREQQSNKRWWKKRPKEFD